MNPNLPLGTLGILLLFSRSEFTRASRRLRHL